MPTPLSKKREVLAGVRDFLTLINKSGFPKTISDIDRVASLDAENLALGVERATNEVIRMVNRATSHLRGAPLTKLRALADEVTRR